jgi:hypothetical protein
MALKPATETSREEIDFTPNWKPLEDKVGGRCQEFMFMGRMGSMNFYKHILTRRYLILDHSGNCYVYRKGKYEPAEFTVQITSIDADNERCLSQCGDFPG